jgi:hypothetical protein
VRFARPTLWQRPLALQGRAATGIGIHLSAPRPTEKTGESRRLRTPAAKIPTRNDPRPLYLILTNIADIGGRVKRSKLAHKGGQPPAPALETQPRVESDFRQPREPVEERMSPRPRQTPTTHFVSQLALAAMIRIRRGKMVDDWGMPSLKSGFHRD